VDYELGFDLYGDSDSDDSDEFPTTIEEEEKEEKYAKGLCKDIGGTK
jgi:hypothetical protein